MPPENQQGQGNRNSHCPVMAQPTMVPLSSPASLQTPMDPEPRQAPPSTPRTSETTPSVEKTEVDGMSCLRNSFAKYNISGNVADILMASWRSGTQKQYKIYIEQWLKFCGERKINCYSPQISQVLNFLAGLYDKQLSYSTLNTARSALSSILHVDTCRNFGSHPLTVRFMKGVFEKRPPHPRYNKIWDVSLVLKYLTSLDPVETLTLKDLTLKLLMLLLLVTGQRGQSIHLLNIVTMHLSDTSCVFNLTSHIKTSKPGKPASAITVQEFKQDCRICPIKTLKEYLKRTDTIRGDEQQLFISFVKPHKSVSRDTISRWAKIVLQRSGIDTELFTSHSTRAASASKAKQKDVPLDEILSQAGWSTADTFRKFYDKPIVSSNDHMASAILRN